MSYATVERFGLSRCVKFNRARSWRCVEAALKSAGLSNWRRRPSSPPRPFLSLARPLRLTTIGTVAIPRAPRTRLTTRVTPLARTPAHVRRAVAPIPSSPSFSAIVVDANSGQTLYSVSEDGLRHPASITKVMTLYLLFEALDRGSITLQTPISISEHAAAQEPSKLGLSPGETISVENAIKAVVTRSANDVAVAIAEAIGQTEDNFADMMTRKARALGMSRTLYRNASGLPNDEQVTTARDLTILGRCTRGAVSALLPLFLDRRVQLWREGHRQSQPPARSRRWGRRNQDRLHPSVRIQPPDLGSPRRTVTDRRRNGRPSPRLGATGSWRT